jgi:hypothetical protein
VPNAVPDPCQAFNPGVPVVWTNAYKANVIGIPVQAYEDASVCAGIITNKQAGTDVLIVRHAELCVPGEATGATGAGTCEADVAGNLYMQSSLCDTTWRRTCSTRRDSRCCVGLHDGGGKTQVHVQHLFRAQLRGDPG